MIPSREWTCILPGRMGLCATPIELGAAAGMLDEEHQDLPHLYTFGRIGEHNAVIACLPAGQTGNNSAAVVAVQVKSKFTSIRFGLVLGIGGGVPSDEAYVRLGDVVISKPYMHYGGSSSIQLWKDYTERIRKNGFS